MGIDTEHHTPCSRCANRNETFSHMNIWERVRLVCAFSIIIFFLNFLSLYMYNWVHYAKWLIHIYLKNSVIRAILQVFPLITEYYNKALSSKYKGEEAPVSSYQYIHKDKERGSSNCNCIGLLTELQMHSVK